MNNVKVINHPLLKHKLGYLRDIKTTSGEFRNLTKEISNILTYEVMRDWDEIEQIDIQTPITSAKAERIINPPVVVSIMRAGNGMLDAVLSMIPFASAGFIGIYRDKFINNTIEYYFKMPADIQGKTCIICDPLLATGDTIIAAIERLKNYEVKRIIIMSILASAHAIKLIEDIYPEIDIYTLNIESEMNVDGYLIPGLGDAGDRLFQTK